MSSILQAGLTVIAEQGQLVFGIIMVITLTASLAQRIVRLTAVVEAPFATGLPGWLVLLTLFAFVWLWIGLIPTLLLFTLGLILTFRFKLRPQPAPVHEVFSLLLLILLSLLMRLAFIKDLLLPSYFDSAQHYLLIRNLLEPAANLPVGSAYYHQGFHWIVALLVGLFHARIGMTMLVFGQILLALMPMGVYGLVRQVTGLHSAGLLAFILAGLGWYMPAHAANWGKYPAIASLALLPFVIWLLYQTFNTRSRLLCAYAAVSVVIVTLLHSRSLIVLGLLAVAWALTQGWERLKVSWRVFFTGFLLAFLAGELLYIQRQGILMPLLDPYLEDGVWVTVVVLVLTVLAWRSHARSVFMWWLGIGLWLGAVLIPVPVPGYGTLTLLDRPYVEMLLFLPLAVTGGLGAGELFRVWKQARGGWSVVVAFTGLSLFIAWSALQSHNFRASTCCILVDRDDLAAITWLDEKLPQEAVIGVAASVMDVLPTETFEGYSGSDAGIWILPLTGRRIVPVPNHAALGDEAVLDGLCRAAVTHVYLGSKGQTFNPAELQTYKLVFSVGRAGLYAMRGCP